MQCRVILTLRRLLQASKLDSLTSSVLPRLPQLDRIAFRIMQAGKAAVGRYSVVSGNGANTVGPAA
jgi:hypothetical protein